jgi:hypothetical protein
MNFKVYPEDGTYHEIDMEEEFWVLRSVSITEAEQIPILPAEAVVDTKFQIFKPKQPSPVIARPKEKIQTLEQELAYHLPTAFPVRHLDRYVVLKDEASAASFKEIKEYLNLNPSKTKSELWSEFKSIPNVDAYLRIICNECLDL